MRMANSRDEGYEAKQEGDKTNIDVAGKFSKAALNSSSSRWLGLRNPRIVRVSRSFGGKDRHSKVCTIRGLRDRRIRLSVPTAIQLYDLQDKLGLGQPSKVIDWLLEATKYDIDKLPPLQFPQGFSQFHHQTLIPPPPHYHHGSLGSFYGPNFLKDVGVINQSLLGEPRYSRLKGKEQLENYQDGVGGNCGQVSTQSLFPTGTSTQNSSNLPALLNNNAMSYNSTYSHQLEPSGLSLSQFVSHGSFPNSHVVDPHVSSNSGNGVQILSSLPIIPSSGAGSQLFFGPSNSAIAPSLFTPYAAPFMTTTPVEESDTTRQFNHVQFLSSSSHVFPHPLIPFSSKLLHSDVNNRSQADKGGTHVLEASRLHGAKN